MMFKKVRTQLFSTQRPNTAAAAPNQVSSTGDRRSRKFATKPIINPETAAIAMRCKANLAFRQPTQKKT
jgi:arginyl-tRNA--protein-N-Asp/Glu arginylyltransferase